MNNYNIYIYIKKLLILKIQLASLNFNKLNMFTCTLLYNFMDKFESQNWFVIFFLKLLLPNQIDSEVKMRWMVSSYKDLLLWVWHPSWDIKYVFVY